MLWICVYIHVFDVRGLRQELDQATYANVTSIDILGTMHTRPRKTFDVDQSSRNAKSVLLAIGRQIQHDLSIRVELSNKRASWLLPCFPEFYTL